LSRFVDGLSQVICNSADDVLKLYEDGYQAMNAMKLNQCIISFTIRVLQRPTSMYIIAKILYFHAF